MNANKRLILIAAIFVFSLGLILPVAWKQQALRILKMDNVSVAKWYAGAKVNLGLDLQGGTELDFKVDLRDVPEADRTQILNGVQAVFERRVNALGVSEPNIFRSTFGDEPHIIVQLAGIKDIDQAKKTIGKVIQLEFKEQNDAAESDQKGKIMTEASQTLVRVRKDAVAFETIGNEVYEKDRVAYEKKEGFSDDFPVLVADVLGKLKDGEVASHLIEAASDTSFRVENGEIKQVPPQKGVYVVKLDSKTKVLRPEPKNAEDFAVVARRTSSAKQWDLGYVRKDDLSSDLKDKVFSLTTGAVSDLIETERGYFIFKMGQKLQGDQDMIRAQHILLSVKKDPSSAIDATQINGNGTIVLPTADPAIAIFNEQELPQKAQEVAARVQAKPETFDAVAKELSQDPGSKDKGGDLGFFARGAMVKEFDEAAFTLEKGAISDPVKTEYGYHVIRVMNKKPIGEEAASLQHIRVCWRGIGDCTSSLTREEAKKQAEEALRRVREETRYSMEQIFYSTTPDPFKSALAKNAKGQMEALNGKFFKRAEVAYHPQTLEPIVQITFNDEGGRMFEELTERLVSKKMAIFVGGDLISDPVIREKIPGGVATISGGFTVDAASQLARDLNAGAIPAPITLAGEQEVGAQLGGEALAKSLKAGFIGVIMLMLFLVAYYRLPGVIASIALTVYVTVMVAFIELWGVVLTLSGVAAVVLSIGMAVDANVLIFERLREELSFGKPLAQALRVAFDRAWNSIRDSNSSSILTALILLWFGTSIIRGFAFMLIVGVLLSLFSAIYVTRTLLEVVLIKTKPDHHRWWIRQK